MPTRYFPNPSPGCGLKIKHGAEQMMQTVPAGGVTLGASPVSSEPHAPPSHLRTSQPREHSTISPSVERRQMQIPLLLAQSRPSAVLCSASYLR